MIPHRHAPWHALQFGILYEPMQKVSGDFLNIYKKEKAIFVLLADVSGHGVPAALITMAANDAFGAAIRHSESPAAVFREVNSLLSEQIKTQDYLTAFLVRIDDKLRMTYANASHQKALHYRRKRTGHRGPDAPAQRLPPRPINMPRDASAGPVAVVRRLCSVGIHGQDTRAADLLCRG